MISAPHITFGALTLFKPLNSETFAIVHLLTAIASSDDFLAVAQSSITNAIRACKPNAVA